MPDDLPFGGVTVVLDGTTWHVRSPFWSIGCASELDARWAMEVILAAEAAGRRAVQAAMRDALGLAAPDA